MLGNLEVSIGDACSFYGAQASMAGGPGLLRNLGIVNKTYFGHPVQIVSGSDVIIDDDLPLPNPVALNGYDRHPLDLFARARGEPPSADGMGPIILEDCYCWLGSDARILKDVRIGRGAVVASALLVTANVKEPREIAVVPARAIKSVEPPSDWVNRL